VKPFVIFNPAAGSVTNTRSVLSGLRRLKPVAIRETKKCDDAKKFARQAIEQSSRYIVVAGGDGTLNEVVNGIANHRQIRIGIVPLGTGNDFARTLGLPSSIEENVDILRAAKTRPIDAVRVQSDQVRYFVNISAGGFSGIVDEKTTPEIKQNWGGLAYVRGAAAALPKLHAYKTRVILDDQEELSLQLYNIVIANGRFVAGGLPIAPDADPSDGLLDIILIPKLGAPDMAVLAAQILLGKHLTSKEIVFRRARTVAVRSTPGMWFNVDGELVGNAPAVFQIVPRALNFVFKK
jgi:diacylglycerol kinase (ATP)